MSDIKYKLKNKIWLAIIPILVIGAAVVYIAFFADEGLFATHTTPGYINQSTDCGFADDACARFDNPFLTVPNEPMVNFGCYNDNGTPNDTSDDINCNVQIGAQNDTEITGWAFSSKYGWINLNCLTDNSCSQQDFGVSLNVDTNGQWYLSDRAWGAGGAGWGIFDSAVCDTNDDGFSNGGLGCPTVGDPISEFRVNIIYYDSDGNSISDRWGLDGKAWFENVGYLRFSCPSVGGGSPTCVSTDWTPPQCSDGIDNDGDLGEIGGGIDFSSVDGDDDCTSFTDDSESPDAVPTPPVVSPLTTTGGGGPPVQTLWDCQGPSELEVGEQATFTASPSGGIYTFTWSFESDFDPVEKTESGTSSSFSTVFNTPGNYTVWVGIGGGINKVCDVEVIESTLPLEECVPEQDEIVVDGQCVLVPPPGTGDAQDIITYVPSPPVCTGLFELVEDECICLSPNNLDDGECVAPESQCSDGIDNDGDNFTDYPYDMGCDSPEDESEDSECVLLDDYSYLDSQFSNVWQKIVQPGFSDPNWQQTPLYSLRELMTYSQVGDLKQIIGEACLDYPPEDINESQNYFGEVTGDSVWGFQGSYNQNYNPSPNLFEDRWAGRNTLKAMRQVLCDEGPLFCVPITLEIEPTCPNEFGQYPYAYSDGTGSCVKICSDSDAINFDQPALCEYEGEEEEEDFEKPTLDIDQLSIEGPSELTVEVTNGGVGDFGDVISDIGDTITDSLSNFADTLGIAPVFGVIVASPIIKNLGKFLKTPLGKRLTRVLGPIGAAFGVLAMGLSFFGGTPTLAALPKRFGEFFLGIVGIPKHKPWGVVYHSDNKFGLDPVVVDLIGIDDPGYKKTVLSDIEGRYAFAPPPPGRYIMTAKKDDFDFPSEKLKGQLHDGVFKDLYFGGEFEVKKDEPITKNIPMDQKEYNWNEYIKNKEGYTRKALRRWKLYKVFSAIFYIGFIVSAVLLIAFTTTYNAIIFALYVLFAFMRRRGIKPKTMGRVMDKDGKPMAFAVIQVFNASFDILTKKVVADAAGLYYCLVPKGAYYVKIQSKLPDGTYSTPFTSKPFGAKRGHIMKTFRIKRPL